MAEKSMTYAQMIIFKSPNCRDPWLPVLPSDVPEWVREPKNVAQMVAGNACCDPTLGETGSDWYRAELVGGQKTKIQLALDAQHGESHAENQAQAN